MTEWRYATTDLRTGTILADTLPLAVESFGVTLGGIGECSSTLPLTSATSTQVGAITPRRAVLWVLADDWPVWNGLIYDWPVSSIGKNEVPLRAMTLESVLDRRRLHSDLTYQDEDPLEIARALITYAFGKTGGEVANWLTDATITTTEVDRTYAASDHGNILTRLQELAASTDFEFMVIPELSDGVLVSRFKFGVPMLGRHATQSMYTLTYPGNILDYSWPVTGSDSANSIMALGDQTSYGTQLVSVAPNGVYQADLDAGFPLFEDTVSYVGSGIVNVATLNAHANVEVAKRAGNTVIPSITAKTVTPRDISLGDYVGLSLTSWLHPAANAQPGVATTARVIGWQYKPAEETMILQFGEV